MMPVIETQRLTLRTFNGDDRAALAQLNADPAVMEFLLGPISAEQCGFLADTILQHWREYGFGIYSAFERDSECFAGFIGLMHLKPDLPMAPGVEIAWRLGQPFWGRGLASEGARAVLDFGIGQLNLAEIVAFTSVANIRSQRVMEKIGMVRDLSGDFDHPRIATGHPLQRHVIYKFGRKE